MAKLIKISDITKFGNAVANSLRARYRWSKQLRKAVKLHQAKDSSDTVSIVITVGEGLTDKSGMPLVGMARAYEGGTEQGTYKIAPRLQNYLQFRGTKEFVGKWIRTAVPVDHPRMKKRGNMKAAIEATKARATADLKLAIRRNLVNELNIVIKGKK